MDNKLSDDLILSNLKYQMRQQRGVMNIVFYFITFGSLTLFFLFFIIILFLAIYFLLSGLWNLHLQNIIFSMLILIFIFYIKNYLLASWKTLKMMLHSISITFLSTQQMLEKISNSSSKTKGYVEKIYRKDDFYFISYKFWDKEQRLFEKVFISTMPASFEPDDTFTIIYHYTFFYTFSLPVFDDKIY